MGSNLLGLEGEVAWATPGTWTEDNFPCGEDGTSCNGKSNLNGHTFENGAVIYNDPSNNVEAVQKRLMADNKGKGVKGAITNNEADVDAAPLKNLRASKVTEIL